MASQDTVFVAFFSRDKEAAVLACDKLGVYPNELLYLPKSLFELSAPSEEHGLVRYTMKERFRQQMFRKLTAVRSKIIAAGNVQELWTKREEVMYNAPGIPELDPTQVTLAAATLDTESDDDGYDEYYRPKPPPSKSAGVIVEHVGRSSPLSKSLDGVHNSNDMSNSVRPNTVSPMRTPVTTRLAQTLAHPLHGISGGLELSRVSRAKSTAVGVIEDKPPIVIPKPQPPKALPFVTRINKSTLCEQEKMLEVNQRRLARYQQEVARHQMNSAAAQETGWSLSNVESCESKGFTPGSFSGPIPSLCSTRDSAMVPVVEAALPPVGPSVETQKQMGAMIKKCMTSVVTAVVGHSTWRAEAQKDEQLKIARELAKIQQAGCGNTHVLIDGKDVVMNPREYFAYQMEQTKLKQATREAVAVVKAQRAEELKMLHLQKAEQAIEKLKTRQTLDFEAARMKKYLADQKREWNDRVQENYLMKEVARSVPRWDHAESIKQRKVMGADISRQAHTELAMMRVQIKESLVHMSATKEWDVPPVVSEMLGGNVDPA